MMSHRSVSASLFLSGLICFLSTGLVAQSNENILPFGLNTRSQQKTNNFDFTIRYGQGGFSDSRSEENKLGGGEITLDIRPRNSNLAISIATEFYTNGPEPTHYYEIPFIYSANILYFLPSNWSEKTDLFFGGGIGRLGVPDELNNPEKSIVDNAYNLQAAIHYKAFRRFGFYAVTKYLTAHKSIDGVKIIDFDEYILLLGISYRFSL